jgi:5'-methylthioadenosine phosphorylase
MISVSAVGSLQENVHPGEVVLVDQFIDRTRDRPSTFFEGLGVVAHVGLSDPTDAALVDALHRAAIASGARVHRGGTYVCIEGPQFSTRAESNVYRSWGGTVIGMTNLPEARLAREAQLPYATVALVTDYDCWKVDEAPVSVAQVVAMLHQNVALAQRILAAVATDLPDPALSPASSALAHALLTPSDRISADARTKLAPLFGGAF